MTTSSKVRKYISFKSKFTPGKQLKVFCPETPLHRRVRWESDGSTSIPETSDESDGVRTIASPKRYEASFVLFWRRVEKFKKSTIIQYTCWGQNTKEKSESDKYMEKVPECRRLLLSWEKRHVQDGTSASYTQARADCKVRKKKL